MKQILLYTIMFITLGICFNKEVLASQWDKTTLINTNISSLETSPWGILTGEFDQRLWNNPYNGIFISNDFGKNWKQIGLNERGVTDIAYSNDKIFVSTYYTVSNKSGLFISNDGGKTWEHLGINFSATTVSAHNNIVLLGGYDHGLWVSNDNGETFEQKVGSGFFGPDITTVFASKDICLAYGEQSIYISRDNGVTWNEIPELSGYKISTIEITPNVILLGTSNSRGLIKSTNKGQTWKTVETWGENATKSIEFFDKTFYASKLSKDTNRYDIYKSQDLGETWSPTNLPQIYNDGLAKDLTWAFSNPSYIFAAVPLEGVYKYSISDQLQNENSFLEIPWQTQNKTELIENIYSFFDHEYPFLGYPLFSEPTNFKNTTVNYLGVKESEPTFYYSGHDGYDFTLAYGTPIEAGYKGFASYGHDPNGLGHYITINHQNGYETTYAHLQSLGLVTTGENKWVETGQQIGLIGMSGNTTGPHLHFSIRKLNVVEPGGRIDPFGWQAPLLNDPWEYFSWTDSSGFHKGSKSNYLWNFNPETQALSNKEIIVKQNSSEQNFTVFIKPYAYPKVPITQNKLTYVTGTSMLINAYNIMGQEIPELLEPSIIEVDISNANTEDLFENTIKIYRWNENTSLWEPISSFYDIATKKVVGEITHFSKFAVFGIDKSAWTDSATIIDTSVETIQ